MDNAYDFFAMLYTVPIHIRKCESLDTFKIKLKSYLFEQAFYL